MIGKADSSTDDSYAAASTSPCHHAHRHATTRDSPRQPPENSRNSCTWSISRVTVSTITTVTMLPTAVVQSHAAATSDFIEAGALENAYSNPVMEKSTSPQVMIKYCGTCHDIDTEPGGELSIMCCTPAAARKATEPKVIPASMRPTGSSEVRRDDWNWRWGYGERIDALADHRLIATHRTTAIRFPYCY
mmetsp:Transcript_23876/g.64510  ORF Transcript_23876/g.64510 Transcript_23876/m.64510 type:complete len:190 (-) Transcript_23876:37-606(-)